MSLLSLPAHVHYYLYTGHADMRRTFEGLCGLVRNEMQADPLNHQVYIFINRRGTQVKLLLWAQVTEEQDYRPGSFFVRVISRPRFADPRTKGVAIAPMPQRPVHKGIAGSGLLAWVWSPASATISLTTGR